MDNPMIYWLWLSLSLPPASPACGKLLRRFSDAERIFFADDGEIRRIADVTARETEVLFRRDLTDAARVLDFCERRGVGILTYADPRFPEALRGVPDPPVLLYYRGCLPDFSASFCVSTVGTRRMTDYGQRSAFHISLDLARAGATIVSGMAAGIDGVALAAALSVGRPTVAVLGSGIDICYPSEHLTLAREIVKTGCIFSEYPPGTPALPYNFPRRNRLISGLSAVTLVVEGREGSGALITARQATLQGRTVYAVPGSIDSETSGAANLLLKNGARACTSADDIIRDFEFVYTGILNPYLLSEPVSVRMEDALCAVGVRSAAQPKIRRQKETKPTPKPKPAAPAPRATDIFMTEKETAVFCRIPPDGDCDTESLVGDGLGVRDVMRTLLSLEIKGAVELLPGERVRRKTEP